MSSTNPPASQTPPASPERVDQRDKFGNREGTQAALINAALTSKPQTAAQIAEKTGLSAGRVSNHFKWLLEHDHVVKTADGVSLKAKSPSKSPVTK